MIVFLLILVIAVLLYRYWTRNHDYWAKKNVRHDKPLPFFGNHLPNFLLNRSGTDVGVELYNKYKGEKIVGYYRGTKPELIIRDPDIINRIFNTDFDFFPGRGSLGSKEKDPLLHNVVFMAGDEWRATRQKFTPAFSPGKLRAMFPLLLQCTEKLQDTVHEMLTTQEEINTYDLMTRFPLQFVGSCGFGVELNALNAEYSTFVSLAKSIFNKSKLQVFLIVLAELLPAQLIRPKIVKQELEDIIYTMTRSIREQRNYKPSGRNDLMDIILRMENDAQELEASDDKGDLQINVDFAAAQLFSLLIAGFDTTATSISFTLHQLAFHPEIQEKIQHEIDDVMSKYDNKLTYEGIGEMSQLDTAWKESMRLFSPFGGITRICAKSYIIPGTDVTIDPGVKLILPSQAFHMDPKYFENPHEFRPERFASGAEVMTSQVYSVFGDGPRKCLGMIIVSLLFLIRLLSRS